MSDIINSTNYMSFLNEIKKDIQTSRVKAALSVNKELILLYWRIGKEILDKQSELGWGAKVIEQLSQDLKHAFPDIKGFGERNLKYMRLFSAEMQDFEFVQQVVAQIPWGHITHLLDRVKSVQERVWYIQKTIENGWSRNVLVMQIESSAHLRFGAAQTNFKDTLPNPTSDLAQQLIKSEYNFEFLGLSEGVHEKVIEKGLINHIRNFLLELGSGFAFLGSQYRVELAGEEFFIDLLMYNVKLKSYVVIELKADKFKPEYAGKLSFYLTAIDMEVKDSTDNPTIGILLCQSSNKLMVEYCLKDMRKPIGVSEYVTEKVPESMEKYLPTPEQFQHLLDTIEDDSVKQED
jgi:predicted nuclease of restriction endonuclease-like (RecB) superfamily